MRRPIIAILRGLEPENAVETASCLIDAGITQIEVPLNSPDPVSSISRMVTAFPDDATFGAGTVLDVADVKKVAATGAGMIVSPDCNPDVIRATKAAGLLSYPGVFTATEAFTALRAGADGLKFFPAFRLGPDGLSALKAVLPGDTKTYMVGGVGPDEFRTYLAAGAYGFGIGSALFKPGMATSQIASRARDLVLAWDAASGGQTGDTAQ